MWKVTEENVGAEGALNRIKLTAFKQQLSPKLNRVKRHPHLPGLLPLLSSSPIPSVILLRAPFIYHG